MKKTRPDTIRAEIAGFTQWGRIDEVGAAKGEVATMEALGLSQVTTQQTTQQATQQTTQQTAKRKLLELVPLGNMRDKETP